MIARIQDFCPTSLRRRNRDPSRVFKMEAGEYLLATLPALQEQRFLLFKGRGLGAPAARGSQGSMI
jgi:hypothetical protein